MNTQYIAKIAIASLLAASHAICAQDGPASPAAPPGNGAPALRFEGYTPPPAIPGYEPSADPRDFTGVWRNRALPGRNLLDLAPDIPLNEAERQRRDDRNARLKAMNGTSIATPHIMCRPTGMNQALAPIAPIYILQNDRKIVFVVTDEIRNVRQVYLNTSHPAQLEPSYSGHSIAHWQGDTLVIDTIAYNGRGALTMDGALHSDKMHLTERITKSTDGKRLTIDATFEDPERLTAPVNVTKEWTFLSGQQPLEFDCEENPSADNFAGMLFDAEYLKPVCIRNDGVGDAPSQVICRQP